MRRIARWLLAGCLGAAGACAPPAGGGNAVQVLRAVCAPVVTRADAPFTFTVTGGCSGGQGDYACVVRASTDLLEVSLLGPAACGDCSCGVFEIPCSSSGLATGTWHMMFLDNSQFDRDLEVSPAAPVFSCSPPDAGTADGG
ncbi:MAG: hypothetical protein HY904_26205 [Deltaproteobacteria bacterium]|nr:hypothetical protein [Deltaproteobacteria bacterium]